jgi:hypothetical protein
MSIDYDIPFPITVLCEGDEPESFDDIEDLELNLEMFDSDLSPECSVRDALGRRVRLKISERLILETLQLAPLS